MVLEKKNLQLILSSKKVFLRNVLQRLLELNTVRVHFQSFHLVLSLITSRHDIINYRFLTNQRIYLLMVRHYE